MQTFYLQESFTKTSLNLNFNINRKIYFKSGLKDQQRKAENQNLTEIESNELTGLNHKI